MKILFDLLLWEEVNVIEPKAHFYFMVEPKGQKLEFIITTARVDKDAGFEEKVRVFKQLFTALTKFIYVNRDVITQQNVYELHDGISLRLEEHETTYGGWGMDLPTA